jgi:hypothetical protein
MANIHAVSTQVAENMVGCSKRLGEYPALSASSRNHLSQDAVRSAERCCAAWAATELRNPIAGLSAQKWQEAVPRFCKYFWWYSSAR